jgi:ATP-binding cassette subfamily F protein uup
VEFGGDVLFSNLDLAIHERDRLCLVGRNGSGKSTLLKIAAGLIEPEEGERVVRPGTRIAYLEQEPKMSAHKTVEEFVAQGLGADQSNAIHRVGAVLDPLDLDGAAPLIDLSGGEQRRAALARALVGEPDILMLDEPTNHLDLPIIEWLEDYLKSFNGAFILISHDRKFLMDLTRACLWLDRGSLKRINKGFAEFDAWSEQEFAREEVRLKKLDKRIAAETEWSHKGITARRKRNQGRLRRLYALRQERAQQRLKPGKAALAVDSGSGSGSLVIEAKNISKGYGDAKNPVIKDFSTKIMRGDKVGIIGKNGSGKTTLLKLLTQSIAPDQGSVRMGTNLTTAVFDQKRSTLDPELTLWQTLCEDGGDHVMVRGRPTHVVTYLKDYLFVEGQARQPVGSLSGGERNRLLLAQALAKPSNLMILDEPTNDLDMETLDLLQEMLCDYEGTVLLVSHDRDFLDRVVTSTIALEGQGEATEYAGGYSDYLKQRRENLSESRPPKTKQKPKPKDKPNQDRQPQKISYKYEHRAKELVRLLPELESEMTDIDRELHSPGLYDKSPEKFSALAQRLDQKKALLNELEEEWLEIEMMREALEK